MQNHHSPKSSYPDLAHALGLEFLTVEQIQRIDQLLRAVGEYGEIHLIVQRGELRFINKIESFKAPSDHAK